MKICPKCEHKCKPCNYDRHVQACNGIKSYNVRLNEGLIEHRDKSNLHCKFCNQARKNYNAVINHERLCKLNPDRQTTPFQQKDFKKNHIENGATKAKKLGLPLPVVSDLTREKIRTHVKNRSESLKKSIAEKVSKTIKEKVEKGEWHTSLAKNMLHNYNGVTLHGKWEVAYAKWLDLQHVKWERCKDSFPYTFQNKLRKYTPDFYLLDTCEYVEIKGYKTEKDDAKWRQFPKDKKLKILVENDLKQLNIL